MTSADNALAHQAHTLADLADLAYFQVDEERNVVSISPAMERLTGFSAADVWFQCFNFASLIALK